MLDTPPPPSAQPARCPHLGLELLVGGLLPPASPSLAPPAQPRALATPWPLSSWSVVDSSSLPASTRSRLPAVVSICSWRTCQAGGRGAHFQDGLMSAAPSVDALRGCVEGRTLHPDSDPAGQTKECGTAQRDAAGACVCV
eukprot:364938-Chlamydomonas_euryale.AAC.39